MSDNEHTAASLGNSEELSVKHSPGRAIPEFDHAPDNGSKIPPFFAGQDTGDVLPYQPLGAITVKDCKIDEREIPSRIFQSSSESCDAERLTRCSSDENIEVCVGPFFEVIHVSPVRSVEVILDDPGGELLDLGGRDALPAERNPRDTRRLNARTYAQELQDRALQGPVYQIRKFTRRARAGREPSPPGGLGSPSSDTRRASSRRGRVVR